MMQMTNKSASYSRLIRNDAEQVHFKLPGKGEQTACWPDGKRTAVFAKSGDYRPKIEVLESKRI